MTNKIKEEIEMVINFFVYVFLFPFLSPLEKTKNYIDKKIKEIENKIKTHGSETNS